MQRSGFFGSSSFNVQNHFLNADTADVFFVCEKNGIIERVPAHKIILAGSSNVFDTMFYGTLCEGNEVSIVDATPNGFRQFLRFFYVNDFEFSLEYIDELMYLSKKYLLESFFGKFCEFLMEQEEADGILVAYDQSFRFDLPQLKHKMENSIVANNGTIFCSEYFANIDRDLLKRLIQIPVLRIEHSKFVFDGCIFWAQANCKRESIDMTMKNLREQLGDCFLHIQFSSMTTSHITECVENFGDMFTTQELQRIVSTISSRCTIPSVGHTEKYAISACTDVRIEVKKGSRTELRFIPKHRMLLYSFTVSECSGFGGDGGDEGYFACFAKIINSKKVFIHIEFFPFDKVYALRENLVLEPNCTYSIHIQFLNNASFFGQKIVPSEDCPIEVLPETNSNFIATLELQLI
ncbi:hypothetical protein HA402_004201 [Bradysia odoriphaga]|nr:hypothetical protein HA402_004201 [Bradysia odoriphaga]